MTVVFVALAAVFLSGAFANACTLLATQEPSPPAPPPARRKLAKLARRRRLFRDDE